MEEILKEILTQVGDIKKSVHTLEEGQAKMQKDITVLKSDQAAMKNDINDLKGEQSEIRKEVAFYFGTMMKELDQTKTELTSEMNHFTTIQKQQQNV